MQLRFLRLTFAFAFTLQVVVLSSVLLQVQAINLRVGKWAVGLGFSDVVSRQSSIAAASKFPDLYEASVAEQIGRAHV